MANIAYVPDFTSTVGKEFPTLGPFKSFKPKLIGPGSGKIKAAIQIAKFLTNPFTVGGLLGIAIGTGTEVEPSETQVTSSNQYNKALRSFQQRNGRSKRYRKFSSSRRNNCACFHKCV